MSTVRQTYHIPELAIENGATLTAAVDARGIGAFGVTLPAAFDGTDFGVFGAATEGGTYRLITSHLDGDWQAVGKAAPDGGETVVIVNAFPFPWLKLGFHTDGVPDAQTAARTFLDFVAKT